MWVDLWRVRAGILSLHLADWIPSSVWFVHWMWSLQHIAGKGYLLWEVSGGCIWWRYFLSWFLENISYGIILTKKARDKNLDYGVLLRILNFSFLFLYGNIDSKPNQKIPWFRNCWIRFYINYIKRLGGGVKAYLSSSWGFSMKRILQSCLGNHIHSLINSPSESFSSYWSKAIKPLCG